MHFRTWAAALSFYRIYSTELYASTQMSDTAGLGIKLSLICQLVCVKSICTDVKGV